MVLRLRELEHADVERLGDRRGARTLQLRRKIGSHGVRLRVSARIDAAQHNLVRLVLIAPSARRRGIEVCHRIAFRSRSARKINHAVQWFGLRLLWLFPSNHIRIPHLEFVDQVGHAAVAGQACVVLKREQKFKGLGKRGTEGGNIHVILRLREHLVTIKLKHNAHVGRSGKALDIPLDGIVMPIGIVKITEYLRILPSPPWSSSERDIG